MGNVLSIIVPCFDVEEFISDCLNSLSENIDNKYKDKIEIIIINDGSTDNTLKVITTHEIMNDGFNIILVNKKNEGLSSARNDGLSHSTGKYIAFLDSDDVWLPPMKKIINSLIDTDSDIVEFNSVRFYDFVDLKINNGKKIFNYISQEMFLSADALDEYKKIVFKNSIWMVWARFYKKELIGTSTFPTGLTYEDIIFTSHMYENAKTISSYDMVCVGYRYNLNSITNNVSQKDIKSFKWVLENAYKKFNTNENISNYFLLVNAYIIYINISYKISDGARDELLHSTIINSIYFSQLFIIQKIKIKYTVLFYTLKKLLLTFKK